MARTEPPDQRENPVKMDLQDLQVADQVIKETKETEDRPAKMDHQETQHQKANLVLMATTEKKENKDRQDHLDQRERMVRNVMFMPFKNFHFLGAKRPRHMFLHCENFTL